MTKKLFLSAAVILVMIGCGRVQNQALVHNRKATDTCYTARAAMKIYGTHPDRALAIIDSALIVGNVSPFRADFIRALVYANSLESTHWSKAIVLCEDLLRHDSTRVVDHATYINRNNVLGVMLDACRKNKNEEHWLEYAIERAGLNWTNGMETEALRMDAEVGAAMTRLGRWEEGMIRLERAIHTLAQGEPSIDRMDASIVALKRRIVVYEQAGRYPEMIADAQAIIDKLQDYENHPSAYAYDSFRLPDPSRMPHYCAFYTAQARAYLARAYSRMTPPNADEAVKNLRLFEASDYGQSYSGRVMIAPALKGLGQWDKLLAIAAETESRIGADTVSAAYVDILRDRADAAKARGRYLEAISYMERCSGLQEQLNDRRYEMEAQEYAARYHAKEQEQEIREAKTRSAYKDAVILAIGTFLFILLFFVFHTVRQTKSIARKNRILTRMINEISEVRLSSQTETHKPDKKLFDLIDETIRNEKLYTNVNLQRQDILDRFDISRHAMNDLFSAYAGGQSFTTYINNMRLQDAILLMRKEPDTPVGVIAEAVGFTPANFRVQFKHQYGITPTEYMQNL